jgi:CheY-like chemotaxis protein
MKNKTVLVVSRHPHLADVGSLVLEQAGYEVITARNPEQIEAAGKDQASSTMTAGVDCKSVYREPCIGTINLRLGAVRRLAYEAADCGLLSLI